MSNGISGIRITSAPPAIPECSAIQPAWRPITSTTRIRLWLSAVVCSRSIASVAICSAVSNPNVTSVAAEVVVDRLRHADHVHAVGVQTVGDAERVLAADRDQPVEVVVGERLAHLVDAVVALVRVRPRAAEDRSAARQDPARRLDRQRSSKCPRARRASRRGSRPARRRRRRSPCARPRGSRR